MLEYKFKEVEEKWQKDWRSNTSLAFDPNNLDDLFYNLSMIPYPSGSQLHIGHWYTYSGSDIFGRFKKMQGKNVLQPLGYDSFGLPAENYAIKTGVAPAKSISTNIGVMSGQIDGIGALFEDKYRLETSSPEYYQWTQWLFLQLYNQGLAFRKEAMVNWDPVDKTVIANEQILPDGTGERSGAVIVQKMMKQWFFKITDYAEELLDFSEMDWPEKTKLMQKNWIGRSEGINITYQIDQHDADITVFTTRPDTNFGATFMVIAPNSSFLQDHFDKFENQAEIQAYVDEARTKTELERISDGRKKTGVFTGLYAINKLSGNKMPIYVSDFVLASVGTGCVVGVPGHDLRDFEFAQEKGIAIVRVVTGQDGDESEICSPDQVQAKAGKIVNSDFLNGMDVQAAKEAIMTRIEKEGWGKRVVNYRLRDWSVARQRYWGAPIPIVYDPQGQPVAIPEEHLPWLLPSDVDYNPTGVPPLASSKELKARVEKIFGQGFTPEYETLDAFVCSSFYFYRYLSMHDTKQMADKKVLDKLLPVDVYVGGPEHACMHLLYARFIHKFLRDQGLLTCKEPFKRLVHQGLITKDGAKMSKSKGNVVKPDDYVEKFGADIFRMYLMFQGPFIEGGDFCEKGIVGILRFRDKILNFYKNPKLRSEIDAEYEFKLHSFIKKCLQDYESFQFNTVLAACMEFYNYGSKHGVDQVGLESLIQFLAPLAPHLAEEIWHTDLGRSESIFLSRLSSFDPAKLKTDQVVYALQINGKLRASLSLEASLAKDEVLEVAQKQPELQKYLTDQEIIKIIFVPGKIVNFVLKG